MPPIVRLLKLIHGLPVTSAKFREHSDKTLKHMGFVLTISDLRIYVKLYDNGDKAFISVHVDDLDIVASNMKTIKNIEKRIIKNI